MLHMTVPREHWDANGFRYRQKILQSLFCTSQGSCTSCTQTRAVVSLFAGSHEGTVLICRSWFPVSSSLTSTTRKCNSLCGTDTTVQDGKVGSMGWFRPSSNCTPSQEASPAAPAHTAQLNLDSVLPGSGCSFLGPHGEQEGAGGSEKPLFRLF